MNDETDGIVGERETRVSRLLDVPSRYLFQAWTRADHLSRWFGPDGFSVTTHRFEFRPGGVWEFTMHGPDGTDYPNRIEWREIKEPSRISWLHGEREGDPRAFTTVFTLTEEGGRTRATLHATFPSREQRDEVVERYGALEGGRQTLKKLGRFATDLAEGAKGDA